MENSLEVRKVVQHNDLIKGVAKMDVLPLKMFELIVSNIDSTKVLKDRTVKLSKQELFEFMQGSSDSKYTRLKAAFKKLHEQVIFEVIEENTEDEKCSVISPFSKTSWTKKSDTIDIVLNEFFVPYVIELKENFTQYLISDIGNLSSKYAIILYKWLLMNYNQWQRYGNPKCKNPSIKINDLRKLTDTVKEYQRFGNFEKWVLLEPIEEINKNTHYYIEYEKMRYGRRVTEIQFFIQSKKDKEEYINQKYEKYEERERDHAQSLNNTLSDALQSDYIVYLVEVGIIKFNDVESVVRAYNELIPYYRDICRLKPNGKDPLEPFRKHINYVAEHIVGTDKKFTNIINYMKECAERYLDKLETQEGQESLF